MAFSYKNYEREFSERLRELRCAYQKEDLFKTICYLKYLSSFYYRINYKLTDDELEEITAKTAIKLLGETVLTNCHQNTVLFYDNFGVIARGLANIYINALIQLNFHVVWVLYDFLPDTVKLQKQYANQKNIEFCIIPKQTITERMKDLQGIIQDKRPKHIFVYTTPEDIAGLGVMSTVKGDTDKYLIDLTDHAFWVGKCAVDWTIGFRNCGYNIAVQYRKIPPEKVKILPYYPDSREEYPFGGMPFDVRKYEFIFSGGGSYKIEGDTTYEEMVQYILGKYPEIKFVYAGNGTNQILDCLEGSFPGRFFHIEEREDLDAILQHAKFYLSTFPLAGGLMTQFAIQNQCVPLTLCHDKGTPFDIKEMMLKPQCADFIFYRKEDIFTAIDRMICDQEYCNEMKKKLSGQVISEEEFVRELKGLMLEKKTSYVGKAEKINMDSFLEIYKKNATYDLFCQQVYGSRNKWVYRKHPIIVWREKRKRNVSKG